MNESTPTIQLNNVQEEQLNQGELLTIPATFDAFLAFTATTHYHAEFHKGEVVLWAETDSLHEAMVEGWAVLLADQYLTKGERKVIDGDKWLITPTGCYHPDLQICREVPCFDASIPRALTNPYLIVEVLSIPSFSYELIDRLVAYGEIPSLQTVVLMDSYEKALYHYQRGKPGKAWRETVLSKPTESVEIDGLTMTIRSIFDKLPTY